MVGGHRSRIRVPVAALGAGGPVVSRIGLGLAALGRPAYITGARLLAALCRLRAEGVIIGLSATGPDQADTIGRALPLTVDGRQLFTATEVTWNLLEPSLGPAAAEAAAAGWAVLVKEAVANGRLTPAGGPPESLTTLAAARGVTEDAIALAAALARPWATVVLSGAVTRAQLDENLAALAVGPLPELGLAETPAAYWQERAARPWH
jgi:aryl-alcohol dehydrogenase-like predicted oxidoreductase